MVTVQESLERFRQGLHNPGTLRGSFQTREELVRRFVEALSRSDTAAFRDMTLDSAEFAWLYYPMHPFFGPPYELDAETMWLQLSANSGKGLARLLESYGGQRLRYVTHRCAESPERHEVNLVWKDCELVIDTPAGRVQQSLFGDILERDGWFGFISYANRL